MQRKHHILLVLVLGFTGLQSATIEAQPNQDRIAQQLQFGNVAERNQAINSIQELNANEIRPNLRASLISALAQEGNAHLRLFEAGLRGDAYESLEDPEFIGKLTREVARLRDPGSVRALAGALGTGFAAIRALVGFGELAAPDVLAVVTAPDSWHDAVDHGLIVLRLMVEQADERPLSPSTLQRIRVAAEHHLMIPGRLASTGVTLRWAIDLAVVLDDSHLREIVERLASDAEELRARGIEAPETIALTQDWASDRLAGVVPMPRS